MNSPISLKAAVIATVISTLIIFGTRAFPFILFSKKEPPQSLRFIEKYIPPMIMAILLVYCLKDIQFESAITMMPSLAGLLLTAVLQLWRHNPLLSIFGGTAAYMILLRVL